MHATLARAVARKSEFGPRDDRNSHALIAMFKLRIRCCGRRASGLPKPDPGKPRAPPWRGEATRARRRGHASHRGPPFTSGYREPRLEHRPRDAPDGRLHALTHRQQEHAEHKAELAGSLSAIWPARSRYPKESYPARPARPARTPRTRGPSWKMYR